MMSILIASLFALALIAGGTVICAMLVERHEDILLALIGEGATAVDRPLIVAPRPARA